MDILTLLSLYMTLMILFKLLINILNKIEIDFFIFFF